MLLLWVVVIACGLLYSLMPEQGLARPIVVIVGMAVVGVLTIPSSRRVEQARRMAESASELAALGRSAEEIEAYDNLVARYGESRDAAVRTTVASALFNKGHDLSRLKRDEEAVAAFDEVIGRFGDDRDADVIYLVAQARVNRGASLTKLNRHDEALGEFQGVVRDLGDPRSPRTREVDARATIGTALSLVRAGRYGDAILACDDGIRRWGGPSELRPELHVASLLLLKAEALGGLGKHDEELVVYAGVVDRHGGTVDPEMSSLIAQALVSRGSLFLQLDRFDEACAADDEAFEWISDRIFDPPDLSLIEMAAQAVARKGLALFERGQLVEAVTAYDRALARLGDPPDPALLRGRSSVLNNRGAALANEEALAIRRAAGEPSSNTIALVLVNKAEALASLGRRGEAVAVCDEVENLLVGVEHPTARMVRDETARIRRIESAPPLPTDRRRKGSAMVPREP
jgi:tetratricopeptide (TPR) repeat protein